MLPQDLTRWSPLPESPISFTVDCGRADPTRLLMVSSTSSSAMLSAMLSQLEDRLASRVSWSVSALSSIATLTRGVTSLSKLASKGLSDAPEESSKGFSEAGADSSNGFPPALLLLLGGGSAGIGSMQGCRGEAEATSLPVERWRRQRGSRPWRTVSDWHSRFSDLLSKYKYLCSYLSQLVQGLFAACLISFTKFSSFWYGMVWPYGFC